MSTATQYKIIARRDADYDDIFFFAVKTTGIYCRPSCAARRPLPQNCLFFLTHEEAEEAGFRACKRCKPNQPKADIAAAIIESIQAGNLYATKTSSGAGTAHLTHRHLRRLVKNKTGKTPLQLDRLRRLRTAFALLQRTDLPVTTIAFQSDFSSVRQFNNIFKQQYGCTPREVRAMKDKESPL